MKKYTEVNCQLQPYDENIANVLMAGMGQIGYDSFCPTETGFKAYILSEHYDKTRIGQMQLLQILPEHYQITWSETEIEDQDWNKEWEDHFTPIRIKDQILIRAGFHTPHPEIAYEIIIEPKMSFGTGHHPTTALMLETILDYKDELKGKKVLDMGCGTGILSIMAAKTGAQSILGIDIDEWSYQNAMENIRNNRIHSITIKIGDAGLLDGEGNFDFVLANINRNILLRDMSAYIHHLSSPGFLIMSGFYTQDIPIIREEAEKQGLTYLNMKTDNNWAAVSFHK